MKKTENMIPVEQALEAVLTNLPGPRFEEVGFEQSLGRVLAADVTATADVPSFHRALMDGYALRSEDTSRVPTVLEIVGEVKAGTGDPGSILPGECKAIMTGAALPEGADAVQMIEMTTRDGNRATILKAVRRGDAVAPRAAEASKGETILAAGRVAGPAEIAVLATFGYTRISVFRRPTVALLATGDELVEPSVTPRPGQIRNSNAYALASQLRLLGIEPDYLGIAPDDRAALRAKVEEGLNRDVLILTGGVSMGEYDFVKEVFDEIGLEVLFAKVAIKPGKPTVLARKGDRLVFGLPGNPVSTFVTFEVFVRPAIGRMLGLEHPGLTRVLGRLSKSIQLSPGRETYLPALAQMAEGGWFIEPLRWKGSGDIIGFSRANAMLACPADRRSLDEGETVRALLLPDYGLRCGRR